MELKQLIDAIAKSDSQVAFRSLFLYFYPKLLLFVSYYIKSKQIAEEVVSDTFLSLWERRTYLVNVHDIKPYIYTIAKNLSVNHLRSKNSRQMNVNISEIEQTLASQHNPETELISSELKSSLDFAVESLPEKCKLTFKLIREHQLKYKEAAKVLEISEKTVEAHMTLAVKKLRGVLINNDNF